MRNSIIILLVAIGLVACSEENKQEKEEKAAKPAADATPPPPPPQPRVDDGRSDRDAEDREDRDSEDRDRRDERERDSRDARNGELDTLIDLIMVAGELDPALLASLLGDRDGAIDPALLSEALGDPDALSDLLSDLMASGAIDPEALARLQTLLGSDRESGSGSDRPDLSVLISLLETLRKDDDS